MLKKLLIGGVLGACALAGLSPVARADGDRDTRDQPRAPFFGDREGRFNDNRGDDRGRDRDDRPRFDRDRDDHRPDRGRDRDDRRRDDDRDRFDHHGRDNWNRGWNGFDRDRFGDYPRYAPPRYVPAPRYDNRYDDRARYRNDRRRYDNRTRYDNSGRVIAGAVVGAIIGGVLAR